MKKRIAIDQTIAWLLALLGGGAVIGIIYFIANQISSRAVDPLNVTLEKGDEERWSFREELLDETAEDIRDFADPAAKGGDGRWGYEGKFGPEFWAELSPSYKLCKSGKRQSPVDLDHVSARDKMPHLVPHYQTAELRPRHDGHKLIADYEPGSYVHYADDRYDLVTIHFRLPSEHTVKGIPYDMEAQLVHRNSAREVLIVAVLFEEGGPDNRQLAGMWQELPDRRGDAGPVVPFNAADLLPPRRGYYVYEGSMTEPPCEEGIQWMVLKDPLPISTRQADSFHRIFRNNSRGIQPIHRRLIRATRR